MSNDDLIFRMRVALFAHAERVASARPVATLACTARPTTAGNRD